MESNLNQEMVFQSTNQTFNLNGFIHSCEDNHLYYPQSGLWDQSRQILQYCQFATDQDIFQCPVHAPTIVTPYMSDFNTCQRYEITSTSNDISKFKGCDIDDMKQGRYKVLDLQTPAFIVQESHGKQMKQTKTSRKIKSEPSQTQKDFNSARERKRVQQMKIAYDQLRDKLSEHYPDVFIGGSKLSIINKAIELILDLEKQMEQLN